LQARESLAPAVVASLSRGREEDKLRLIAADDRDPDRLGGRELERHRPGGDRHGDLREQAGALVVVPVVPRLLRAQRPGFITGQDEVVLPRLAGPRDLERVAGRRAGPREHVKRQVLRLDIGEALAEHVAEDLHRRLGARTGAGLVELEELRHAVPIAQVGW
jgi:hypothetical protein